MQLEKDVKKDANSKIKIEVTVNKDEITKIREKVIHDIEKNAKLPGFRKGKVPRKIILTRFSDQIKNETISNILYESIDQVIKEGEFKPISEPVVTDLDDLSPDKNFTFKAEFDVMPEVTLKEYKGLSATKYEYEVPEKLVDDELETLRERFSTLVSVDEPAKEGYYLVIDYIEYDQNGKEKYRKNDQTFLLDDKEDPFAKELLGIKKGEEKDVTITLENKLEDGKDNPVKIKVHVKVKDIKKKELPELDDDFAQDISDVSSLAELKEKIKKDLEEEAKKRAKTKTMEKLIDILIEKNDFNLPESMINYEIDRIISEIAAAYRLDIEKLKSNKEQYEEYRKNIRDRAIKNLKQELILAEIAKAEKLEASDSELEEEIKKYAEENKKDFNELKENMKKNKTLESLRYQINLRKALDFVHENAKFDKTEKVILNSEGEGEK
ncbi:MAG: trigger factor [Spirochaetes bacterium]|nr:MAG: trigger factor [Spirochaetota bacterium]